MAPNFPHLVPNFAPNSDHIAPNMPGRTRRPLQTKIFLDSGPFQVTIFNDFGYIFIVFPWLFCTLRPTSELYFRPLGVKILILLGAVPCVFCCCHSLCEICQTSMRSANLRMRDAMLGAIRAQSLHISIIFCICFLRRFACLAPARLIFYAIGWTSTWCCDGRLAKPAQSGAAPTGCCKP